MMHYPKIITTEDRYRRARWKFRNSKYLLVALSSYAMIVLLVWLYLQRTPVYSSVMSIVLPTSGSSSNFLIKDVGQANQQTKTPFGNVSINPLANYKEILKGGEVLKSASIRTREPIPVFGKPRIEIKEQTSIIFIHLDGLSPSNAQQKSWAIYDAFQEELQRLRADETLRHDESIRSVLDQYRIRVARTRAAIIEFQSRALLVSKDQLDQLMKSISILKETVILKSSASKNNEDFVRQLSVDLGVSPSLAGQAFLLQSDAEYRGYLKELDASAAKMTEYKSKWGAKHPKLIHQTLRYNNSIRALKVRSEKLVSKTSTDALHRMDLQSSPERAELFATLVSSFAKLQGSYAELKDIELSEIRLNDRLKIYSREAAELERLEREHTLAEAVFTSAAAKLEASKANVFASYPIAQMLSVPTLPDAPKSPNTKLAIVAGILGMIFVTFGLITLWQREYLIRLLLKRS